MVKLKNGYIEINGKKQLIMGMNYLHAKWGHTDGFWYNINESEINSDMKKIKSMGVDAIRLPLPLTMMKKNGVIEQEIVKAIEQVISIADSNGLLVVPNLLHTGGFHNTEWVTTETAFTSDKVLEYEIQLLKLLVDKYKKDSRILAWDICNEPWWIFGSAFRKDRFQYRELINQWLKKYTSAMRDMVAEQPFTVGVDHGGVCQEVGGDADAIAENVEFTSPHFYSRYIIGEIMIDSTNSLRDTYYGPFIQIRATPRGKTCIPFEFGNSTQFISEEKQAIHFRTLLYSSLVNGAAGWFPWVFQDFQESCWHQYQDQPHETYFGMFRSDGSEKPVVEEIRSFSNMIKKVDPEKYGHDPAEAAIIGSKNWYGDLSYASRASFNAFCLAKEAGVDVDFTKMTDDWSPYKLIICLTTLFSFEDIKKIRAFVENGGVFYVSPTSSNLNTRIGQDIFGVTTEEVIYLTESVTVMAGKNWKSLEKGTILNFNSPKLDGKFLYSMTPEKCEVIMWDEKGRPALVCNQFGKGYAVHISFPLEYAMAVIPDAHQNIPAYKIYRSLVQMAGLQREIEFIHPFVETGLFHGEKSVIAVFINHEHRPVSGPLNVQNKFRKAVLLPDEKLVVLKKTFDLGPNEVKVIRFEE